MKKFKYQKIKNLKFVKRSELTGENYCYPVETLQRFYGSGETYATALEALTDICISNGIPIPQKQNDTYYCGHIKIKYIFKTKTRLNTVFFKERNGRKFAIIFYPRL